MNYPFGAANFDPGTSHMFQELGAAPDHSTAPGRSPGAWHMSSSAASSVHAPTLQFSYSSCTLHQTSHSASNVQKMTCCCVHTVWWARSSPSIPTHPGANSSWWPESSLANPSIVVLSGPLAVAYR
uniref:Uncharacterized protein n=1 Tax=Eutreptiella gymnastica TaxID=73025 RepID=A0A7S1IMA9_9EUGL|mmetsp:Transcript_28462/g.51130  ORF Transcript_28462/g.51130 Transcript_28462/m.51130 type:complete len:126 (+) Transcript_28462:295-672(+)